MCWWVNGVRILLKVCGYKSLVFFCGGPRVGSLEIRVFRESGGRVLLDGFRWEINGDILGGFGGWVGIEGRGGRAEESRSQDRARAGSV